MDNNKAFMEYLRTGYQPKATNEPLHPPSGGSNVQYIPISDIEDGGYLIPVTVRYPLRGVMAWIKRKLGIGGYKEIDTLEFFRNKLNS